MLEPMNARDLFTIAYAVLSIVGSLYVFSAALLWVESRKQGKRKQGEVE